MLAGLTLLQIALYALAACLLDRALGEPRRFHPLVGFGALAQALEARLNRVPRAPGTWVARVAGAAAVLLLVLPPAASLFLFDSGAPQAVASVLALYFALGARSLKDHVLPICDALEARDLAGARRLGARVVSRDLASADAGAVATAAVESALENGNDAVFGALFWFALAGAPGALAYRLVNTLDAMWGYRTPRFERFGWCAARLDDALNLVPARLTAATYALLGDTGAALRCWRLQAGAWKSPNAGPVMAAGAGALGLQLGGAAVYHGEREARPLLGSGRAPCAADARRALRLVETGIVLWLGVLGVLALLEIWQRA